MVKRYKGGLMTGTEATTSISDARGIWGTVQATQARKTGNWPALLTTETPGPGSGAGFANGFMTVSNVSVTDSNYNVLNDTPNISTAGGYIKLTGRGFVSGCVVYVGGVAATSTTFISSTEVRAQIAATTSNTLMVYVVNPDGSTGIKLSSLVFSGTPTWVTGETLTSQVTDVVFSISFSATSDSAVTYLLNTGSSLPPGTSLFANGLFTGTVTGLSSDTTYSFSVLANDAENQDTARTFNVTFGIGDSGFYLTPVLMNAEGNLWIKDSSNNGFTSTAAGDARPSAFSPYNTNWSLYFSGASNYLTVAANAGYNPGNTGAWTFECFVYPANSTGGYFYGHGNGAAYGNALAIRYASSQFTFDQGDGSGSNPVSIASASSYPPGRWYHFSVCKDASNVIRMFVDGVQVGTQTSSASIAGSGQPFINGINDNVGFGRGGGEFYLSDVHWVVGTALYTNTPFTPPSGRISTVANSKILIGQTRRFLDTGSLSGSWTTSGTPQIKSFGPFAETDTFSGSGYFDGTGDYLDVSGSSNLAFGTNDFTIEFFAYIVALNTFMMFYDSRTAEGLYPAIYKHSDNTIRYYVNSGQAISGPALAANTWYHIVVSRVSGITRMFVNGTQVVSTYTDTNNYLNGAGRPRIGANGTDATSGVNGYISNLRVLNGTGYTSVNVPTAPLTAVANTQLLTLQYRVSENSHRFIDEAGLKHMITRTGEVHQGSFSPFSPAGWSAYFDGTGDYLTLPSSSEFNFGTGEFTIEAWIYLNAIPTGNQIFEARASDTLGAYAIGVTASSKLDFLYSASRLTSATSISVNTWTHIAVVRASGTIRMFINGVADTNTVNYSSAIDANGTPVIAGGRAGGTSAITGYYFNGYISNFRIVKGLAVYTGNFTPPTSILGNTQTSGSNISAITSGSTFLSLQNNRFIDNGVNAFTITRFGDTRIHAFSPFRASGQYSPALHGGSAYFDGSTDFLTVPANSVFAFGTGDFTVECWAYITVTNTFMPFVQSDPIGASTNNKWFFATTSTTLVFQTHSSGGFTATTPWTPGYGSWQHFAAVRQSGTMRLFVNGVSGVVTVTGTPSGYSLSQNGLTIGGMSTPYYLSGYISGLRLVTGQALFTGNFAIPTAPPGLTQTLSTNVAAMTGNVTMLTNFTHSGIIDHTGRNNIYTFTSTNIRSSNVQSKFGGGSIFFTGGYQYLFIGPGNTATHPPLLPTIGDYTVEFWVYATASDTTLMCLNTTLSVFAACRLQVNGNGSVGLLVSTSVANVINISTGAGTFAYNTWQHIAVVRNGGSHIIYINGTNRASSTTIAAATAVQAGVESVLGCIDNRNNSDFASFFQGYIDDFRVTRYARYTADFTPTTTAFLTR